MDKSDIIKMLDAEIRWCFDNPDEKLSKDYRKGFTNGLVQAKYLMNELASQPDVEADANRGNYYLDRILPKSQGHNG